LSRVTWLLDSAGWSAGHAEIRLLKDGRVVETFDAKWTINIADIASEAGELEPQHGADYWEIVNDIGATVMPKSRWSGLTG